MAQKLTFRGVIDAARFRGLRSDERPRTMKWAAEECGISDAHIYALMSGTKGAQPWTIVRIANGLGISVETVTDALKLSREPKTKKRKKRGAARVSP